MVAVPEKFTYVRPLSNGDRMVRHEFHNAYCNMPESYRAELIGGIVFEPSPLGWDHSEGHSVLNHLLVTYSIATAGTRVGDNASLFLSDEDEVQPDLILRIEEQFGGRSKLTKKGRFLEGSPELVAEIAYSSRAIDLHLKKDRYHLAGVNEYIVFCLNPVSLYWFDLRQSESEKLQADADGIIRSRIFPGLWIHEAGLLETDRQKTLAVLNDGIASAEHDEFALELGRRRTG